MEVVPTEQMLGRDLAHRPEVRQIASAGDGAGPAVAAFDKRGALRFAAAGTGGGQPRPYGSVPEAALAGLVLGPAADQQRAGRRLALIPRRRLDAIPGD